MFDIGMSHLLVIAVVGILVLGPEKLPGFIRDVARIWRTVRGLATDAGERISSELLPDAEDRELLNPRALWERAVDGVDHISESKTGAAPVRRHREAS